MDTLSENIDQITSEKPKLKDKKKVYLLFGVVILLFIGLIFFVSFKNKRGSIADILTMNRSMSSVSPTPFPFQELTIPYLRNRAYKSTLGELDLFAENGNYTAYLTSYDSDGLKINALLTKPIGEKPTNGFPAIIFIHGYIPPSTYQTTSNYADYVDYLARNGFVVFKIDLRGHGNSEGEPGGGYYGSDYIADTLNAYAALGTSGFVDAKAIGLWGHSMAGNIVMRSMAAKPDMPAVVIWAGAVYSYSDQRKYGIRDSSYQPPQNNTQRLNRRRELFDKYGSPSAENDFWQQVAPTSYLNDLKGAIQINHALDDAVVDIGYSRDLMTLLDKTSVPHELHEYATGGHNISGSSFNAAMQNTVEFFKKYLDN